MHSIRCGGLFAYRFKLGNNRASQEEGCSIDYMFTFNIPIRRNVGLIGLQYNVLLDRG